MAVTLADLAQVSKDPLYAGVLEQFLMYSNVMKVLPWKTIGDLRERYSRWSSLPTVAYRAIGGTYTADNGTFEQLEENLAILGHYIDVDIQLEGNASQMVNMGDEQSAMTMKAMAYLANNDFINGDRSTDPNEVDGLKVRVGNLPARQTVNQALTTSLDVFTSTATVNTFFDLVIRGLNRLETGHCDAIFLDETSLEGVFSAIRRASVAASLGDYQTLTVNGNVWKFPTLNIGGQNIPLITMGFTDEGEGTKIITQTEDPGDGGNDCSSLYLVNWQNENCFRPIQKNDVDIKDLGELQTSPQRRVRFEWPHGYCNPNNRSIVRVNEFAWK